MLDKTSDAQDEAELAAKPGDGPVYKSVEISRRVRTAVESVRSSNEHLAAAAHALAKANIGKGFNVGRAAKAMETLEDTLIDIVDKHADEVLPEGQDKEVVKDRVLLALSRDVASHLLDSYYPSNANKHDTGPFAKVLPKDAEERADAIRKLYASVQGNRTSFTMAFEPLDLAPISEADAAPESDSGNIAPVPSGLAAKVEVAPAKPKTPAHIVEAVPADFASPLAAEGVKRAALPPQSGRNSTAEASPKTVAEVLEQVDTGRPVGTSSDQSSPIVNDVNKMRLNAALVKAREGVVDAQSPAASFRAKTGFGIAALESKPHLLMAAEDLVRLHNHLAGKGKAKLAAPAAMSSKAIVDWMVELPDTHVEAMNHHVSMRLAAQAHMRSLQGLSKNKKVVLDKDAIKLLKSLDGSAIVGNKRAGVPLSVAGPYSAANFKDKVLKPLADAVLSNSVKPTAEAEIEVETPAPAKKAAAKKTAVEKPAPAKKAAAKAAVKKAVAKEPAAKAKTPVSKKPDALADAIVKSVAAHSITIAALGKQLAKQLSVPAPTKASAETLAVWLKEHKGKKSAASLIAAAATAATAAKPAAKAPAKKAASKAKPAAKKTSAKKATAKKPVADKKPAAKKAAAKTNKKPRAERAAVTASTFGD